MQNSSKVTLHKPPATKENSAQVGLGAKVRKQAKLSPFPFCSKSSSDAPHSRGCGTAPFH